MSELKYYVRYGKEDDPNFEGAVELEDFENWTEVYGVSWSMQGADQRNDGVHNGGRAVLTHVCWEQDFDANYGNLCYLCAQGTLVPEITVVAVAGNQRRVFETTLTDARIAFLDATNRIRVGVSYDEVEVVPFGTELDNDELKEAEGDAFAYNIVDGSIKIG